MIVMVDHNNIDRCYQYYKNGLMMPWSNTERLENVHDEMKRMKIWPSIESHDNTKVKLIILIG